MKCQARLEQYLREHSVPYEVEQHHPAFTAQEIAQAEHISGRTVAKVVIATADETRMMFVLPATEIVDFTKAAAVTHTHHVSLVGEADLAAAFPDCEVGAMPPFGNLYDMSVYVDTQLAAEELIVFPAGSHSTTIRMRYTDFENLVLPEVGAFGRARAVYAS